MTKGIPVLQYDKKGKLIAEYPSISEAARHLGDSRKQANILLAIHKNISAYGYYWREKDGKALPHIKIKPKKVGKFNKPVRLFREGRYLVTFDSINQVSQFMKIYPEKIRELIKTGMKDIHGYNYEYANPEHLFVKKTKSKKRPVCAYDAENGEKLATFMSVYDAGNFLDINYRRIYQSAKNNGSKVGYFRFMFAGADGTKCPDKLDISQYKRGKVIYAKNMNSGKVLRFDNLQHCAEYMGLSRANIYNVLCGKQIQSKGWTFSRDNKFKKIIKETT